MVDLSALNFVKTPISFERTAQTFMSHRNRYPVTNTTAMQT